MPYLYAINCAYAWVWHIGCEACVYGISRARTCSKAGNREPSVPKRVRIICIIWLEPWTNTRCYDLNIDKLVVAICVYVFKARDQWLRSRFPECVADATVSRKGSAAGNPRITRKISAAIYATTSKSWSRIMAYAVYRQKGARYGTNTVTPTILCILDEVMAEHDAPNLRWIRHNWSSGHNSKWLLYTRENGSCPLTRAILQQIKVSRPDFMDFSWLSSRWIRCLYTILVITHVWYRYRYTYIHVVYLCRGLCLRLEVILANLYC